MADVIISHRGSDEAEAERLSSEPERRRCG